MLVNGTVFPYMEVEQRQYRFRMLNACQARFVNPRLVYANGATFPASTEPNPNAEGPGFIQIGTECGFLPAPAPVNGKKQPQLLLAPAERADWIVDFSNVPADSILILYSDAPAPFPMGDALNDYYPKNPKTPSAIPGYGPNTRTILQIRVKQRVGAADPKINLPANFVLDPGLLLPQVLGKPTANPAGVPVRRLTLNETSDGYGRLVQYLGTDAAPDALAPKDFGREYMMMATETPQAGTSEVWEIINLTGDTHPIHLHLVNYELLSRQPFSVKTYKGGIPNYLGPATAPDSNEMGWKETLRMNPAEVTRILMKFDLPSVPFTVPFSPNPSLGVNGYEYVWHCHILDHEEHDMMRPLVVVA
jgi:spore coat protein A, manganese oxidase